MAFESSSFFVLKAFMILVRRRVPSFEHTIPPTKASVDVSDRLVRGRREHKDHGVGNWIFRKSTQRPCDTTRGFSIFPVKMSGWEKPKIEAATIYTFSPLSIHDWVVV